MGSKQGNQIVTEGESDQKTFRSEDWVQRMLDDCNVAGGKSSCKCFKEQGTLRDMEEITTVKSNEEH